MTGGRGFPIYRGGTRTSFFSGIDNIGIAFVLLLLGSYSHIDTSASEALSGNLNTPNIIRFGCIIVAFGLLAPELRHPLRISITPLWLFAVYILICLASTLWSVNPVATLGKAAESFAATAVFLLATNRDPGAKPLLKLVDIIFAFGACSLVAALAGYLLNLPGFWLPSNGVISHQLSTWFISANGVGYASALTGTIALNRAIARPQIRSLMIAVFVLCVVTAILAQGRTGWLCFALGALLVLALRGRYTALLASSGVALIAFAIFATDIQTYFVRGAATSTMMSLSGRTEMWTAAWQSFLAHPLAGVGYGVGGRSVFVTLFAGSESESMSSLHSGFMELLTGVGIIGFVPWFSSLSWTLLLAVRSGIAGKNVEACAVMLPVLAMTIMSNGAGGWLDLPMSYFLCSAALLSQAISTPVGVPGRIANRTTR